MNIFNYLAATLIKAGEVKNMPTGSAVDVLAAGLNITYFVAGALAVIIIILAGYTFATSVYDPAKITQAKNAILYAVVGLVVVIFAFVITQFILGRWG